jgi:hypothetical protein
MPHCQYPRCHCDGFQYFLDLPRELRDHVYRFVVADLPSRIFISSRMPLSNLVLLPDTLPSICFVSKRLHEECASIYLQRTRLVFDDLWPLTIAKAVRPLQDFLLRLDRGYESIRMLTFHEVSRFGSARLPDEIYPGKFITRCTGLQDLVIDFRFSHLLTFRVVADADEEDGGGNTSVATVVRPLTKEELQERWGLGGLFGLENLRSVRFRCTIARWQLEDYGLGSLEDIIGNLGEVLREGFEARARSLTWSVEAVLPM